MKMVQTKNIVEGSQTKMHDYFIRQNQEQTAITYEKEDLDFEAGFKKVDCIIYVYCNCKNLKRATKNT